MLVIVLSTSLVCTNQKNNIKIQKWNLTIDQILLVSSCRHSSTSYGYVLCTTCILNTICTEACTLLSLIIPGLCNYSSLLGSHDLAPEAGHHWLVWPLSPIVHPTRITWSLHHQHIVSDHIHPEASSYWIVILEYMGLSCQYHHHC